MSATSMDFQHMASRNNSQMSRKNPSDIPNIMTKIKNHPRKYNIFADKFKPKFTQDAQIFGKPSIIVNKQGIDTLNRYKNTSLNKFSLNELVHIAENFSSSQIESSLTVRKILEKIDLENNQNEYNRTEI